MLKRLILIAGVLVVIGFAVLSTRSALLHSQGTNRDEVILVCTACNEESRVTSVEFAKLAETSENLPAVTCPNCGKSQAYTASLRCPSCARAIPHTPGIQNTAYVCPFCKAPLAGDEPEP